MANPRPRPPASRARPARWALPVPFGSGKFLAAWANTKMTGGAKRDTVSLGYDYAFSKRSDLYAVVMHDKITSFSSGTSYAVGLRHRLT